MELPPSNAPELHACKISVKLRNKLSQHQCFHGAREEHWLPEAENQHNSAYAKCSVAEPIFLSEIELRHDCIIGWSGTNDLFVPLRRILYAQPLARRMPVAVTGLETIYFEHYCTTYFEHWI